MRALGLGQVRPVAQHQHLALPRGERRLRAARVIEGVLQLTLTIALAFVIVPRTIGGACLGGDGPSLEIAGSTIVAAGLFMPLAGGMAVSMGALRGAGDMLPAMGAYALGFILIGIPAAWLFAFRLNLGAPGLIYGLMTGVSVALAVLLLRFWAIAGRDVRRV